MTLTTEPNVGERIRELRVARKLSLRALAEKSSLSTNAISLIERGENSPTVSSLHRLATALGVPISDFFKDAQEQAVVYVTPEQRLRSEANGIELASLATGLRNQQLEPFLMRIGPGVGNRDEPVTHNGEEFVHCLEGEVNYCVDEQVFRLHPGDSLLLKAEQPHCFENTEDKPARLLIIFLTSEGTHQLIEQHR